MRSFIIIALIINSGFLFSQNKDEILELKLHDSIQVEKFNYAKREYQNEYDFFFSKMFLFYKNFVSDQDASSCSFHPSCSEYAILAIKKQGLVIGIINFFDRFSRCNGVNKEHYEFDIDKKLLIDPIRDHNHEIP